MQLGGRANSSFYLESCVSLDVISWWIQERKSIKLCANPRRSVTDNLAMTRQAFGEEAWAPNGKVQTQQGQKRQDKRRACLSFSLTSRGFFSQNSSWQAKQPIPHTTITFYGNCLKMCEDFARTLATKELTLASWISTVSHFPFHRGILDQKQHDCHPQPTVLAWIGPMQLFCFPDSR
jgi:hypothetical protein